MAKVIGGLHGRPSGNVGGIIYGGARTRTGKVVTARELVFPSNPKTTDQQLQRRKFKQSLYATRHLAAALWQDYFNRAIGQLPGFQSMMSIILDNTDDTEEMTVPPDTPLGNLHFPETYAMVTGDMDPKSIDVTWSAELGLNGTVDDLLRIFGIAVVAVNIDERPADAFISVVKRSEMAITIDLPDTATDYVFGSFFEGAGVVEGILSNCGYEIQTTK